MRTCTPVLSCFNITGHYIFQGSTIYCFLWCQKTVMSRLICLGTLAHIKNDPFHPRIYIAWAVHAVQLYICTLLWNSPLFVLPVLWIYFSCVHTNPNECLSGMYFALSFALELVWDQYVHWICVNNALSKHKAAGTAYLPLKLWETHLKCHRTSCGWYYCWSILCYSFPCWFMFSHDTRDEVIYPFIIHFL